jgi:predicted nuclease of predicted toxin-antitoxin system
MRVLLDECVDPRCKRLFSAAFEVRHVRDMDWLGLKNGELVRRANESFDFLFTIDSNMRFQMSLRGLTLRVAVARPAKDVEQYALSIAAFEAGHHLMAEGAYTVLPEEP